MDRFFCDTRNISRKPDESIIQGNRLRNGSNHIVSLMFCFPKKKGLADLRSENVTGAQVLSNSGSGSAKGMGRTETSAMLETVSAFWKRIFSLERKKTSREQ